jgi:anti-sigma B factor antagonist
MSDRSFGIELSDGSRRARLSGELDMDSYDELSRTLGPAFDADGDIELDLADVTFIDSSAIRLFAQLQRSRDEDAHVVLVSPQPQVSRVLEVAGMADLGIRIRRADDG